LIRLIINGNIITLEGAKQQQEASPSCPPWSSRPVKYMYPCSAAVEAKSSVVNLRREMEERGYSEGWMWG
jgi:hypothetical protein